MIKNKSFTNELIKNGINFFTGVPDSLFKDLCWHLEKKFKNKHKISPNEGSSISLGIGYHLATNKMPLVYFQNSGLGNSINPLVSLADNQVYGIPIFLLIGWRGEILNNKQLKDEPQHKKQGKITPRMLKLLGIKYKILNSKSNFKILIKELSRYAKKNSCPVALLVRKGVFQNEKEYIKEKGRLFTREMALGCVLKYLPRNSVKISTTGMLSRELYEKNLIDKNIKNTFMCIGGMGHSISISSGIALVKKNKKIFCLDGDGSFLMHLGASASSAKIKNLVHIVFNNKSHDSVGGHETSAPNLNLRKIAKELGYSQSFTAKDDNEIKRNVIKSIKSKKSFFLEIRCKRGNRSNLSRPKGKIVEYKKKFKSIF